MNPTCSKNAYLDLTLTSRSGRTDIPQASPASRFDLVHCKDRKPPHCLLAIPDTIRANNCQTAVNQWIDAKKNEVQYQKIPPLFRPSLSWVFVCTKLRGHPAQAVCMGMAWQQWNVPFGVNLDLYPIRANPIPQIFDRHPCQVCVQRNPPAKQLSARDLWRSIFIKKIINLSIN